MLKVSDNPVQRFPEGRALSADEGKWAVAHIKPRQEKSFAKDLFKADVGYYLPLVEKRTRRKDNGRIRKSILPLIPGYVPFAGKDIPWEKMPGSSRLINVLKVENQTAFIHEFEEVKSALESGLPVSLVEKYEPGQEVFVKSGPMMGMKGEVVTRSGKTKLIIKISFFERSVSVDIEDADLECV